MNTSKLELWQVSVLSELMAFEEPDLQVARILRRKTKYSTASPKLIITLPCIYISAF